MLIAQVEEVRGDLKFVLSIIQLDGSRSADEAAGKEKSLKEGNLRSQNHPEQKHACKPTEHPHGFKGKRACHH